MAKFYTNDDRMRTLGSMVACGDEEGAVKLLWGWIKTGTFVLRDLQQFMKLPRPDRAGPQGGPAE
jgi:hypothetical protein